MSEQQINEARKIIGLIYMFYDISDEKYFDCLPSSMQILKDHLKDIENIKFKYYEQEFKICKDRISNYLDNNNGCYDELGKILRNLTTFIKEEYYKYTPFFFVTFITFLYKMEKQIQKNTKMIC